MGRIHDQIKAEFPTTSLATAYKTVILPKALHEVLELVFPDRSNQHDGNKPNSHPHMICVVREKVMGPKLAGLKGLTEEAGRKTGFRILTNHLDFFGLCPECRYR